MGYWRQALETLVRRADQVSDHARYRLRKLAGFGSSLVIAPYIGYGNGRRVVCWGRVLRDEGFREAREADTGWRNLVELYKRLESDEVPGARVRARCEGVELDAVADDEGYFNVEFGRLAPSAGRGWLNIELELLDPQAPAARVRADALALVPPATATTGIISDIDDTVVQTNVIDKLEMLLTVALTNARTRKPFKGVGAFYRALQRGASGVENNPIFYVSSSPWNLYAPLVEFMQAQNIPVGPILLRDFGDHMLFAMSDHHSHKLASIERILGDFPQLPFVLIGDSGEQDPEIYAEVVERHPQRIRAIYIRSVDPAPSRLRAIDELVEKVRPTGTQLVLAPDSEFAAVHAAGEGLILPNELANVRADKRDDDQARDVRERAALDRR